MRTLNLELPPVNGICIMKNVSLNKKTINTLKNKKYKIITLKHINKYSNNASNTSVSAHYFRNAFDRTYVFFETSCNNITSPFLCEDMSLCVWIVSDPISFRTLMKCFNENAYYFLKRKYPTNKEN